MSEDERFLVQPGRGGPFGALMDEYARAAEDFLRVLEAIPERVYQAVRASPDPDTRSPQAIAAHVCGSAFGYCDYIRAARDMKVLDKGRTPLESVATPDAVRPRLAKAIRATERALEDLWDADYPTIRELEFQVRWGPAYDPEMILEHAIVHLLRHRRQLERWRAGAR